MLDTLFLDLYMVLGVMERALGDVSPRIGGYLHLIGKIRFRFWVIIINILFKNMVSKLHTFDTLAWRR